MQPEMEKGVIIWSTSSFFWILFVIWVIVIVYETFSGSFVNVVVIINSLVV